MDGLTGAVMFVFSMVSCMSVISVDVIMNA